MKLLISLLILSVSTSTLAAKKIGKLPDTVPGVEKMIQISGTSTGYDKAIERRMDGHIDFAIVLPSLTKKSILFFDLNNILSPKSDNVNILKQDFPIPSNFSLPKQKESYILSIKLNKPLFRTFVAKNGVYPVTALHGKFKVKTVIDKLRDGEPIFSLLNDFKFMGGDQIEVNTKKKKDAQDASIKNFQFKGKASIKAPSYDQEDLTLFSLPMAAMNRDTYHPTDLKYVESGQTMKVTTNKNSPMFSLNILTDQVEKFEDPDFKGGVDEDGEPLPQTYLHQAQFNRITLSFLPLGNKLTPNFLNFVDPPQLSGSSLSFTPPAPLAGTTPLATVVELIEGQKFKNGKLVSEFKKSLWKTTLDGWKSSVSVPDIGLNRRKGVTYRYEVSFLATSDSTVKSGTGEIDLNKFSYLTKNYLVIK